MKLTGLLSRKNVDSNRRKSSKMLKEVWSKYVAPQWLLLIVSVFFMLMAGALEALSVLMLEPIFNDVFIDKNREVLLIIGLKILAIFFFKGLAIYIQSVTMGKIGITIVQKMQTDLYRHLVYLDLKFFNKNNSAHLLNYFVGDINIIREAVLNGVTTLIKDFFTVLFLVCLMFMKNLEMALITSILFPIAFYPLIVFGRKIKSTTTKLQGGQGALFGDLTQSIQGIRIVKAYSMEEGEIAKVKESTGIISALAFRITKIRSVLSPMMEFFGGVAIAATLGYGGYQIMQGKFTPGEFMVFLLAIVAAYKPLKSLANINATINMGLAAMERVYSILDVQPAIPYEDGKPDLKIKNATVQVENVSFGYDDERDVVSNLNLVIPHNKTTAIVGASGSGKSTLINLILRFYDVKTGSIKIDGQDIRDVSLRSLRNNIAFVSQDVVLFDDTIKNNILFGKPDATDEEIVQAARNSAADVFISIQSEGYNTRIGERGSNLSGGQRQMVSIARAMLKDAPILLLDEATSALDAKSEKIVQNSLEKLMQGRTTVVIAHRLSTVINADNIVVFDDGRIIEQGTHAQLMAKGGAYSKLHGIQFASKEKYGEIAGE